MRTPNTSHIIAAMRKPGLVGFVIAVLVAFGIWSLPHLNKDEFPQFTIRQGVVAVPYPGATAREVEEQVTGPLERYLFTFEEVNKQLTYSYSRDGMAYVFVELNVEVMNKDEVWSKIRHGLNLFRMTGLPRGVPAVVVIDDFGNTASILLAVESPERTPRELEQYALGLTQRLRTLPEMGKIRILGQQSEEIAITINPERLAAYGINQSSLVSSLALQGFRTVSGSQNDQLIHIDIPYQSEYELTQQIVFSDPVSGQVIRLGDIATLERRYKAPNQYINYYEINSEAINATQSQINARSENKRETLLVSLEMRPGNNIVEFGRRVDDLLREEMALLPPDVQFHRITDQPHVVEQSVMSFLRDLCFSILVVIAVMLVLFPLRTALVSSTGVPVCIAITLGLMYLCGIELNTVTLAALIVVLGMIVDDSVIVIDGYTDMLYRGHSRWYSAVMSTAALFIPMSLATCSISGMFFPMTRIITGPLGEFVQLFPWAVCFALTASIFYAVWVIPGLATRYIRRRPVEQQNAFERLQERFFSGLQEGYQKILTRCFRHPWLTLLIAVTAVALGGWLFTRLNVQMMPKAEREVFAVEIHMAEGTPIEETAVVADSLARILTADPRVVSVTSFVGCASPRFHATYSPQMASPSYAQFIVNTRSQKATAAILREYTPRYENAFPEAYVRFKQMDYQAVKNPLEIYLRGDDLDALQPLAEQIKTYLSAQPQMQWVHSDYDESRQHMRVVLHADEATRLGITQSMLSLYLSSVTEGQALTNIWEDDYSIPVMLYTEQTSRQLEDMLVPTAIPGTWVPLRQVADIVPDWQPASITHRNGVRTITVGCDLRGKASQPEAQQLLSQFVDQQIRPQLPEGATIDYGGLTAGNKALMPQLILSVFAALLVLFVLMIYHFGKIGVAVLALTQSILCILGACLGLWIFDYDFGITALLGLVSLIGIIVRNAIIMYEYAEVLVHRQHMPVRQAAFEAGLRRMRPIFLTSATTALGVIPMITAGTSLWAPMGVVICFGTIFTLPLVVTVLPIAYWKVFDKA